MTQTNEWSLRRAIHGTFTDEAKAAVPHLVGALKDPEWRVRITAAYTLGQLGSVAKLASAQLQEAKAGEDKQVVVCVNRLRTGTDQPIIYCQCCLAMRRFDQI